MTQFFDRQTRSALRELEEALLANDLGLAGRILRANPDLDDVFAEAARVFFEVQS